MPKVYYNEFDPDAAAWLRELIKRGAIAPGDVDERSIEDVTPGDLAGYTQVHLFAGIGGWSHALRRAGWPDERPVWTFSCPCQPFSSAGKAAGFADERHLWPAVEWLLQFHKPPVCFAEQVASKDGLAWLDLVQADLEAQGYTVGPFDLCSAGVGSPNIRQRLFIVADTHEERFDSLSLSGVCADTEHDPQSHCGLDSLADAKCRADRGQEQASSHAGSEAHRSTDRVGGRGCTSGGVADTLRQPGQQNAGSPPCHEGADGRGTHSDHRPAGNGEDSTCLVGDPLSEGLEGYGWDGCDGDEPGRQRAEQGGSTPAPGPTNGFWRDADWIPCRDGKARPVEPGTFPLASGVPARVVRLRGYGNAINAVLASEFIKAYCEARGLR